MTADKVVNNFCSLQRKNIYNEVISNEYQISKNTVGGGADTVFGGRDRAELCGVLGTCGGNGRWKTAIGL